MAAGDDTDAMERLMAAPAALVRACMSASAAFAAAPTGFRPGVGAAAGVQVCVAG